jgi:hypothetical protein
MTYRATFVSKDPLNYFLQTSDEGPHLRVSDVVVRTNLDPTQIFSRFIRLATNSNWSHSALLYLINDPPKGFDNTFLVEAMTSGVRVASWRNEVVPYNTFTVGIKRLRLDWYVETPRETSKHDPTDPEDVVGIDYLRHIRGMAIDQVNNLYDHNVVWELTSLYIERVAREHLAAIPLIAEAAAGAANMFKHWEEDSSKADPMFRFICSGLVQFSFFEALRVRINNDLAIPAHRDAAMSNLSNLSRIIFRDDPQKVVPNYIQQVQSGKLKLSDPVPGEVTNLLQTSTPADFNDSPNLEWRYIIKEGMVWQISPAPDNYIPASQDESSVLALMRPAHTLK